jgi:hypothetical protein
MDRNGWSPAPLKVAGERVGAEDLALRATLMETIQLARRGAWTEAEQVLHAALSAVAPEALPHVYIACVELVPTLLNEPTRREGPAADPSRPDWATIEAPRSRARPGADPALNYAHAIVTALRLRLESAERPRIKQAS